MGTVITLLNKILEAQRSQGDKKVDGYERDSEGVDSEKAIEKLSTSIFQV